MATYDKEKLLAFAVYHANAVWKNAFSIWGDKIGQMPVVEMNARLTACGGRAFMRTPQNKANFPDMIERVDFSCYLMERNPDEYKAETIPHELAHFIAFRVYGDENHGKGFKYVMYKLGCRGDRCHPMVTKNMAAKRRITSEV